MLTIFGGALTSWIGLFILYCIFSGVMKDAAKDALEEQKSKEAKEKSEALTQEKRKRIYAEAEERRKYLEALRKAH